MDRDIEKQEGSQSKQQKPSTFNVFRSLFSSSNKASDSTEPLLGSSSRTTETDSSSTLKHAEGSGIDSSGHTSLEQLKEMEKYFQGISSNKVYRNLSQIERDFYFPHVTRVLEKLQKAKNNYTDSLKSQNIYNAIRDAQDIKESLERAMTDKKLKEFATQGVYTEDELSEQQGLTSEKLKRIVEDTNSEVANAKKNVEEATRHFNTCISQVDTQETYDTYVSAQEWKREAKEQHEKATTKASNAQANYNLFLYPKTPTS